MGNDTSTLAMLYAALRARAQASNHRLVLVLTGGPRWTFSAAAETVAGASGATVVWLSERTAPSRPLGRCLPVTSGGLLLGSEIDILVYDAHGGFDPDSFAAALGSLRGGGLLLLLAPQMESWPRAPDPQAARVAVHPFSADQVTGRYLARFVRVLQRSNGVTLRSESSTLHQRPHYLALPSTSIKKPTGDCRTTDQVRAVEAVLQTAYGRSRRPLVLTADRGRGKSSALGIAVASLLKDSRKSILVTAPRRSSVDPVFQHATRLLPDAQIQKNRIADRGSSLEFLPPDKICHTYQSADLLLVDEAAGIPAPLLEQMLNRYSRVVFASTVQGYEGTGQGFDVRFRRTLDHLTPGWRKLRLETPIRWSPGDPIERLAAKALLLDAKPALDNRLTGAFPQSCRFELFDRDRLATDEATLSQLFGLLVLAHYQTRPMDLRHLLDGPNIRVSALFYGSQVAATALVAVEGGLDAELARAIFEGRRRPRGHLLPQTLSAHAGLEGATPLRYARVIRIAVHPAVQGRGLGRFLLQGIVDDARTQDLDLAGSSFGATGGLLAFWEHCGFPLVHLGTSRNAASGTHAAVVLHPLTPAGESMQSTALKRLAQRLPSLLSEPLQGLEPEVAACLLRNAPRQDWSPDPAERRELAAFAFALRSYEATLPLLAQLVGSRISEALRAGKLDDSERDLLIFKVLQHRDWTETARLMGQTGRAQAMAMLRKAAGKLIEHDEGIHLKEGRLGKPQGAFRVVSDLASAL